MRNILFRVDSSSTIGTGHIMRDLVLAEQFKGDNIIFSTQDLPGNINHKIKEKEYTIEILHSNNIEELDTLIKKLNINMIVIDHYSIDYDFEKKLKKSNPLLTIMSIDDTYEKHYSDILLNHNISANSTKYDNLVPQNCEVRCGSKYTLIRDEFVNCKRMTKKFYNKKRYSVFVGIGGSDPQNYNMKIIDCLTVVKNLDIHIVTTSANQKLDSLKNYTRSKDYITLHIDSNNIAKLMNELDFAIITPSVILNEILFMKIPFIAIKIIENQDDMYVYLKNECLPAMSSREFHNLPKYINTLLEEEYYTNVTKKIDKYFKMEKEK